VVTAFAFHIQEVYNAFLEVLREEEEVRLMCTGDEEVENNERMEEEMAKGEVILGELLRMAVKLDYSDEIGRRKVFAVVSEYRSEFSDAANVLHLTLIFF
jgi:condensin complex subunit 3